MKRQQGRVAMAFFLLLFALAFGAVGAFASWAIGVTVHDGWRARDWVKVAADVDGYDAGEIQYRYRIDGREYSGRRLTVSPLGGEDGISEELHSRLAEARAARRPITVFVNPEAPAESMVDRDVHWTTIVFMLPFALGFGGVGLGALWGVWRVVRPEPAKKAGPRVKSDGASALGTTWVFAFFWNVIAFPIAIAVLMEAIPDGEWLALLVLLFPLIGLLILFGAIAGTWNHLRRGGAVLELGSSELRMGGTVAGHIRFPRGVATGESFRVKLACIAGKKDDGTPRHAWSGEQRATVSAAGGDTRLAFSFKVPNRVRMPDDEDPADAKWRLEAERADKLLTVPYGFDLAMQPAPAAARIDLAPEYADEPLPAMAGGASLETIQRETLAAGKLTRSQEEVLAAMTPEQRAQVQKLLALKPLLRRVAIGIFIAILAFILLPSVLALLG